MGPKGPDNPGLVREGEGLLEVELDVDAGGDTMDGDLTGGDVGEGEEPAGGCGFSCSWSLCVESCLSFMSSRAACFASVNMSINCSKEQQV